jgi:thiosulfate/3-mercaptopyruvate sulfurtransferase
VRCSFLFASANLLLLSIFLLGGCALQPTKTREAIERKYDTAGQILQPIKITEQTVIVDARPAFDYSMAHVPRSVNLQWTDFTQSDLDHKGLLQEDLFSLARRLALLGVAPATPVVVIGRGLSSAGEEGRIAWTLAYLGVTNVQFAEIESLKFRFTNAGEQNPLVSVPAWKPEPVEDLNVRRDELIEAMNHNAIVDPMAYAGRAPVVYRIIDVRGANDYLGREDFGAKHKLPNMGAINIPWKEFFDKSMRPRPEMAQKLKSVGVLPDHRVVVIDENGLSSADVTMAMRALGFSHTGNLSGGLADVLSTYTNSR